MTDWSECPFGKDNSQWIRKTEGSLGRIEEKVDTLVKDLDRTESLLFKMVVGLTAISGSLGLTLHFF